VTATETLTAFAVGDRVVITDACEEAEFVGLAGEVAKVHDLGYEIKLDEDPEVVYDFVAEELQPEVTGFMAGETDEAILEAISGRNVLYYNSVGDCEDKVPVSEMTPLNRHLFEVVHYDDPTYDQIHFVGPDGFHAIYLSAIIEAK